MGASGTRGEDVVMGQEEGSVLHHDQGGCWVNDDCGCLIIRSVGTVAGSVPTDPESGISALGTHKSRPLVCREGLTDG